MTLPAVAAAESSDRFAAELRAWGPIGIIGFLIVLLPGTTVIVGNLIAVPGSPLLVLLWSRLSRTPWHEIGYVRPRSWTATLLVGAIFGMVFKLVMKSVVMPLLGADPINQAFHFLAGNQALLPRATWAMLLAGVGEETVFRGFLFERLGKLFGSGAAAKIVIVLITSAFFAVGHYPAQRLAGTEQAAITGLVFGIIYATRGQLFMLMTAHAAFDLTALAIIYWDVESTVAHFIVR